MMKILLPVDGSENALRAVRHVIAMKEHDRDPIDMPVLLIK